MSACVAANCSTHCLFTKSLRVAVYAVPEQLRAWKMVQITDVARLLGQASGY